MIIGFQPINVACAVHQLTDESNVICAIRDCSAVDIGEACALSSGRLPEAIINTFSCNLCLPISRSNRGRCRAFCMDGSAWSISSKSINQPLYPFGMVSPTKGKSLNGMYSARPSLT